MATTLAALVAAHSATAAGTVTGSGPGADWPGYFGANGAFSETSGVKLVNDMVLHRKAGQWTGYKVTGSSWNVAWHKADLSRLACRDGRLSGPVAVTLLPDRWVPADHRTNVVTVAIDAAVTGRSVAGRYAGNFGGTGTNVVGKIRRLTD